MKSRTFARGHNAVAICQRSGQKMRYADLVEDGHVPGLLVHPDWWEPRHPQETPPDLVDPIALRDPSPENPSSVAAPSVQCGLVPEFERFFPSSELAEVATPGDYQIVVNDPVSYAFGECIYVELDCGSGDWFVTTASVSGENTLIIYITDPFPDGPICGPVFITPIGGGHPLMSLAWAPTSINESMVESALSTIAEALVTDGTGPYTYEFVKTGDLASLPLVIVTPTSVRLSTDGTRGGSYVGEVVATVTDDLGDQAVAYLPVTITVPLLTINWDQGSLIETVSTDAFSAIVSVSIANGRAPYTYQFQKQGQPNPLTLEVVTPTSVRLSADGAVAGIYSAQIRATVTDDNGESVSVNLNYTITVSPLSAQFVVV